MIDHKKLIHEYIPEEILFTTTENKVICSFCEGSTDHFNLTLCDWLFDHVKMHNANSGRLVFTK